MYLAKILWGIPIPGGIFVRNTEVKTIIKKIIITWRQFTNVIDFKYLEYSYGIKVSNESSLLT